ncbi:MAG: T9SS type A sorting domain-containing protein [Bacteroidota bacterium]|nr:T9SS type A sorting domain-containing protein [Bacteroidota bacterium]
MKKPILIFSSITPNVHKPVKRSFAVEGKQKKYLAIIFILFCLLMDVYGTTKTWMNASGNNKWSTSSNWSPSGIPGTSDDVILDITRTDDLLVDVNVNVLSLAMRSGYTGTVSVAGAATITIGSGGFSQADGVFIAPALFTVGGNFTNSGGTYIHNNGNINFTGTYPTLTPGDILFNDLTISVGTSYSFTVSGTTESNPLKISGSLVINSLDYLTPGFISIGGNLVINSINRSIGAGSIYLNGNLVSNDVEYVSPANVILCGTGDQYISTGTNAMLPGIFIKKPSGTADFTGANNANLRMVGSFENISGTVNPSTFPSVIFISNQFLSLIPGSITFGDLTVSVALNRILTVSGTTESNPLKITGNLIINSVDLLIPGIITIDGDLIINSINRSIGAGGVGSIYLKGNLVSNDVGYVSPGNVILCGTGDQYISTGTNAMLPGIIIKKSSGTADFTGADNANLRMAGSFVNLSGTLNPSTFPSVIFSVIFLSNHDLSLIPGSISFGDLTVGTNRSFTVIGTTESNPLKIAGNMVINSVDVLNPGFITIGGDLTINSINRSIGAGSIYLKGNLVSNDTSFTSTGNIILNGTGTQYVSTGTNAMLPGIIIDKSSGTVDFSGADNANLHIGGSFVHMAGTVSPSAISSIFFSGLGTTNITPGSLTFGNITVSIPSNAYYYNFEVKGTSTGSPLVITGNLTLNDVSTLYPGTICIGGNLIINNIKSAIYTGSIFLKGNLTSYDTSFRSLGNVIFNGTGTQYVSTGTNAMLPGIIINKSSGTVDFSGADNANLRIRGSFAHIAGTVSPSAFSSINFSSISSITPGSLTFGNITVSIPSISYLDIFEVIGTSTGNPLVITGNLTLNDVTTFFPGTISIGGNLIINNIISYIHTGSVFLKGNLTSYDTSFISLGNVIFNGTGTQYVSTGTNAMLPGIIINKSSGTVDFSGADNANLRIGGSFEHIAGTVSPSEISSISFSGMYTTSITPGSLTFGNITVSLPSVVRYNFEVKGTSTGNPLVITGNLTLNYVDYLYLGTISIGGNLIINNIKSDIYSGSVFLKGNLYSVDAAVGGNATITLNGTTDQHINALDLPNGLFTIDKPSGTVYLNENLRLNGIGQDFRVQSGTLDLLEHTLTLTGPGDVFTLESGATLISFDCTTDQVIATTKNIYGMVSPVPEPVIIASGSTDICEGSSVTLTSDNVSGNLWSNLETTQSIIVSQAGNYNVSNSRSCGTKTSNTIAVTMNGAIPLCNISVTPENNNYTGGVDTNIYLGYGPQSATITANATGGSGFTYAWSPSTNLSCNNCQSPVFTPTAEGNYTYTVTVTNSNGCSNTCIVSFCVTDIRVSGKNLVYVCHGNKTVAASVNAIHAHLINHNGDRLGPCNSSFNLNKRGSISEIVEEEEHTRASLKISCTPNPFASSFKMTYESNSEQEAQILIYGITGNLIQKTNLTGNKNEAELGKDLPAGIYTVLFVQGNNFKVLKVIKAE